MWVRNFAHLWRKVATPVTHLSHLSRLFPQCFRHQYVRRLTLNQRNSLVRQWLGLNQRVTQMSHRGGDFSPQVRKITHPRNGAITWL